MIVLYFLVIGLLIDWIQGIQYCLMYFVSFSLSGYTFSFLLRSRFFSDPFQLPNILRTCISCRPSGLGFWCHNSSHTSSWELWYLHEYILRKILCNWDNKLHHSVHKECWDFWGLNCIFGIGQWLMSHFPSFSSVLVPKNHGISLHKLLSNTLLNLTSLSATFSRLHHLSCSLILSLLY